MEIKLIATDLDGTFVDDNKQLLEENVKAFAECAELGIEIVPTTGRTKVGLPDEIKQLPGVHYAITNNGGVVVNLMTGEVIHQCLMEPELAVKVMEFVRDSEYDVMYDAYIDGIGYNRFEFWDDLNYYVRNPGILELVKKTRIPVEDNIAYVRNCGCGVEKINLFFPDMEARANLRKQLAEIPGILVTSSLPNNLEINALGADKGTALLHLADHLKLKKEEIMALGDGENDITMIRMAGLGVAMANAEDHIKEVADYVTVTNNEAGVAAAVRKFVL